MANEILVKAGTPLVFGVSASFSPADPGTDWSNGGSITDLLTLSGVANNAARQSDKADLAIGATALVAPRYACYGAVDFTGETPTVGNAVHYYWAPSRSATQGTGNVAGNSGADAACPGGALGSITIDEFVRWCIYIGSLVVHDGAVVQNGFVGVFSPPERYGQLIVVNRSGDAFEADDVEAHQVLVPLIDEVQ